MNNIIAEIITNLQNVFVGAGIFAASYIFNMIFCIYYNIKSVGESFDKSKFLDGICKVVLFSLGTALGCIIITALPEYATYVGFSIPEEYVDVFSDFVIIAAFLVTSCKYVFEGISKMKNIITGSQGE